MTKQAESCKTRSLRARKAVRKPPETVRKRNRLASPPRLPATRKAFSDSETAVPCSETAPSGGAFFAIFILQITIFPLTTALPQKSKENVEHSKLERRKATIQRNGIYRPGWGNDISAPGNARGRECSIEKRPAWAKALLTGSYFALSGRTMIAYYATGQCPGL